MKIRKACNFRNLIFLQLISVHVILNSLILHGFCKILIRAKSKSSKKLFPITLRKMPLFKHCILLYFQTRMNVYL